MLFRSPHKTYRHCTAIVTCTEFENNYDYDDICLLTDEMISKKNNKNEEEELRERENLKKDAFKTNEDKKYNRYQKKEQNYEQKEEEELPKGVASINKTEKIIMENGFKKKITKIVKIMEDGSKQIETTKEVVDE